MKAPLHTRPVTNNAAHTNNKCQCQAVSMAYVLVLLWQPYITLYFKCCAVLFFLHLSVRRAAAVSTPWLFGESDVNANDRGQAGTFGLMLICLHIAPRAPCTLIWSLTSKDKQWCKSAHPQSMSFLEVVPPTRASSWAWGRLGGNRELGNQIYWHFFKGDSWWKDRGNVRKSGSPFTC